MQKKSLLNFRKFTGIFEDGEDEDANSLKGIDLVMNIFFEIYGIIVTRVGSYKDSIKDYQAIADSENEKRGELMVQTINKISDLSVEKNPSLKKTMDDYKKSMEFLKQAYEKILAEDKSQLLNIKKKIKDMIIAYLESLVSNVKNTELPELEKKNESLDYLGDLILEKDLYVKERRKIIKSIIPLRAKTLDLANKSIFPEMQSAAKSALKKYDSIIKNLQDDNFFDSKKRAERAEEIENFRFSTISIENELNSSLSKIAIKYGVAKEIDGLIKKSLESLNLANTSLKEIEAKQAQEVEKTKIEDSEKREDEKKGEEKDKKGFEEIKEGDKNPDSIKDIKKKLNQILPKNSSLEDTGDYDKKLKDSLSTAVKLMKSVGILDSNYKEDTGKITKEFQEKIEEYIKKMEEIKKELTNLK